MKTIKEELFKLKKLSVKERVEYIVEYYGVVILTILGIIFATTFLTIHFLTHKDLVLGMMVINADGEELKATNSSYFESFLTENGLDPKENEVSLNYSLYVNPHRMEAVDDANLSSIQTIFTAGGADIICSDEELFQILAERNYFKPIESFLTEEEINNYKDDFVFTLNEDTNELEAVGIRLQENKWIKETGWYTQEAVVGITDSLVHEELAQKMLKEMIGE